MREIIILVWALISTMAHPKPESQDSRVAIVYKDQNNEDIQRGFENDHYSYNQQQANWGNYNSDQSRILFKPLELTKELESTNKAGKNHEQYDWEIKHREDRETSNIYQLDELLSDNSKLLLNKSKKQISKLEDELTQKSKNWEDKLNEEVRRFEESLKGGKTNNFANNKTETFLKDQFLKDDLNTNVEEIDFLPIHFEKPNQYEEDEYKFALDGSKFNSQIVFEHLVNSDTTKETRKGRIEREASYGNTDRYNSHQGNTYNLQNPEAQQPNINSWRPKFPGHTRRNDEDKEKATTSYISGRRPNNQNPHFSEQYSDQSRYGGQKPFEDQSQTDDPKFGEQSDNQHGLDELEFGQKRENMGQEQTDEVDFTESKPNNQGQFIVETDYEEKQNQKKNRGKSEEIEADFSKIKDFETRGQKAQTDSMNFGSQHQIGITGFESQNEDDGQKPTEIEEMEQHFEHDNHRKLNDERGHRTNNDNQQNENSRFDRYQSYQRQQDKTGSNRNQQYNSQTFNHGEPQKDYEGQIPVEKFEIDQADKNNDQFKSMGQQHGTYHSSQRYYSTALAVQSERKEYISPQPTTKIEFHTYKEYTRPGYFSSQQPSQLGAFNNHGPRPDLALKLYSEHSKTINNGQMSVPYEKIQDQSRGNPKSPSYQDNFQDYLLEDQRGTLYWVKLTSNQAKDIEYGIQRQTEKAKVFNVEQQQQMKSGTQIHSDEVSIGGQRPYKIQERVDTDHLKEKRQYASPLQTGKINFVKLIPLPSKTLHYGQQQINSDQLEGQTQFGSQQQTDNVDFGEQGTLTGQQQVHGDQFDEQRQYGSQQQTDDVKFEEQRTHSGQQQFLGAHYGGQTQYGSQKQTDDVEFGEQRPHSGQQQLHGAHYEGQRQFGSQQQTDDVEFGEIRPQTVQQQMHGDQHQGQKQFGSQQQTDDVEFGEQRQYGSQQQTDSVEFGEQRQYGSQQQTDNVEFGEQRPHSSQGQMHGIGFEGQRQYRSQHQTDDVEFGEKRPYSVQVHTHGAHYGGQRQYGSQQQTDDVEFGQQRPHSVQQQTRDAAHYGGQRQYGSQQQTDYVEFGQQRPHFSQQQRSDDHNGGQRQYGSQQQTDEVEFGQQRPHFSQQQKPDDHYGGQRQYGSQQQTDDIEFGEQKQFGSQYPTDNAQQQTKFQEDQLRLYESMRPNHRIEHQTNEQFNNQRKLSDSRESSYVYQRNTNNQNQNQQYYTNWSGHQRSESNFFTSRDSTNPPSNVNPSLQNSEFSDHSQNSYGHSLISSSDDKPYSISSHQQRTFGYGSTGIYPEASSNIHRNQESSYRNQEENNSKFRVKIVFPDDKTSSTKTIDTSTAKVNKYQMMMSHMDEIEKSLVEQQTKANFVPMRQYQLETETVVYPATGYMEHLKNSQEEISSRPHFEYNSDEEEEPKSFWSNLGSKMKSSYTTAKDKTKKLITNIKGSFSSE